MEDHDYTDNLEQKNKRYHRIVKYLEESGLLNNGVSKKNENEAKEKR